ncbi:hypothetical protein Y032_0081g1454 [Ancylostoma ceylanicum]|uniref:EB domain-containing protein n=1 Tax=Ancylostoma ceylanicum TaxID=53326 RepID=A0A016TRD8_9BILA|nr:hypothetical protein Y032_0081g1454 [Ancylostoma ceylanicum]
MKRNLLALLFTITTCLALAKPQAKKCTSNLECEEIWPGSTCQRSRCRCPENYVRRRSPSREWVCLAVNDAATGQVGPPFTCPLPDGAGYQVVLRNAPPDHLAQSVPVLCSSKTNDCETGYECIQGLSAIDGLDGVCCPDQSKFFHVFLGFCHYFRTKSGEFLSQQFNLLSSSNNLRPPDIRP